MLPELVDVEQLDLLDLDDLVRIGLHACEHVLCGLVLEAKPVVEHLVGLEVHDRLVEQNDVVMAELTGTVKRAAGGEMRMSMAEVFVMRGGKIAERRAWVIMLNENAYR